MFGILNHRSSVLFVALVSAVVAAAGGGSARAAGACPDPAVEATVNIDGTDVAGCRAIFRRDPQDPLQSSYTFKGVPGGGKVRVLVVGGGGAGSRKNLSFGSAPNGGGNGGAGGEVVNRVLTVGSCRLAFITVGGPALAYDGSPDSNTGFSGVGNGQPSAFTLTPPDNEQSIMATGGNSAVATSMENTSPAGYHPGYGRGGSWALTGHGRGAFGRSFGGGGGASNPAVTAATEAPSAGTGGSGGAGTDVSASFPGLANAQVGGGGGGFGHSTAGPASHGGGTGGTNPVDAAAGVDGTGGGGGGASEVVSGSGVIISKAGRGGDGIVVVDFAVPASTSCSTTPAGAPSNSTTTAGASSNSAKPGGGASSGTAAAIRASATFASPQVPAGGTLTVTVRALNTSTEPATNARIVFPAPRGFSIVRAAGAGIARERVATWAVGTIKPNATVTRKVTLRASADSLGRKRIRFSVHSSIGTVRAKAVSVWVTGPSTTTG